MGLPRLLSRLLGSLTSLFGDGNDLSAKIQEALEEEQRLWSPRERHLELSMAEDFLKRWRPLYQRALKKKALRGLALTRASRDLAARASLLVEHYQGLLQRLEDHNRQALELRAAAAAKLILPVEGKELDVQQLRCIVTVAPSHLVLAGAGTGKTITIVGYVKYLLKSGLATADDVLILSFTNASASEMSQRLEAEMGIPLAASTFHKLALDIITAVQGKKPRIRSQEMGLFVRKQLETLIQQRPYLEKLNFYLLYHQIPQRSDTDFSNPEEYQDYLRSHRPTTLNGEPVKSYGEMAIANFLHQQGLRYLYEAPYPMNTRTSEHGQYRPDFYLPDFDVYIEYFAIDRQGRVPPYFKAKKGMTVAQTYQEGILWKRALHRDQATVLIELYSYQMLEGTLLSSLEEQLHQAGVTFEPPSPEELWAQIKGQGSRKLDDLAQLFGTVITLAKSNGTTLEELRESSRHRDDRRSIEAVLDLIDPIYRNYQEELKRREEIDFNDMINLASDYLNSGRYRHGFRYVVVDEYQDLARSRYRLLQALREQQEYRLFCVGDDWQSIYRFTGSDISFILDFERYWGPSEISRIETTYRFPQSLSAISGQFIMKNPHQKVKKLQSAVSDQDFALGTIAGYNGRYAMDFLAQRLATLPERSSVLLLGRYHRDLQILEGQEHFSYRYDLTAKRIAVTYRPRPDLDIAFMTIHGSKGLQADYVFLLNNKAQTMGFPSQIVDAPVLALLLEDYDDYPFAEERRLFYVAITRARKKVWLVTLRNRESIFVREVTDLAGSAMEREGTCPRCGGHLLIRRGPYGSFYGCSNYGVKGCNYSRPLPKSEP